ncbi:mucin-6 [Falco peregrinus]|uniref:mucin-6 n=1 Tax=Falco peregrinus TaxID=8954 RepID=UPI00247928C2|nr:mucin-6 [Falco peregrinus]
MFPIVILLICSFLQSAAFDGNYWPHFFLQKQKESLQKILSKDSCSTWGGGHFSTFDKYQYDFTGTCNYIFATVCDETSPDFNIQFRRGLDKKIARIIIELGPSVIIVEKGNISIRSVGVVKLPYTSNGIQIAPYGCNIRLVAKLMEMELVVMWNNDDYLMVLTEKKYMGKTCGMCGNYDGYELNEFVSEGKILDTYKFAALQKMDDPSEICLSEEIPISTIPHKKYVMICSQLLNSVSPTCSVPKDGFVIRCQLDMQDCSEPGQNNCTCSTLSEYSRQCAMSHQMVFNWRTENLCSVGKCSANQIYEECGSPCIKTCSNPEYSCSSHCTYGCFCPEGTVLDDISKNRTCVHIKQCPCTLNGKTYAPGEAMKAACRTCKCTMGQWNCKDLPCPGRCSLEGGSFVTTFDSRSYRFHGVCTYVLMKSSSLPHNGTLMAVYEKSGYSYSETSLSAIIYLSAKDKIVISQNELLTDDDELKRLPYRSGDITIFRQSSMYIQMYTTFGLELLVQTSPVFQTYVKVGSQFKGRTLGLCGNYNGDTTDDFMTSMDITEGTASLFVDSWRAGNCHPALERDTDPCALSQLNKISAETHCSILTKKGTVFEKCHAVVNPIPFYKRCVYQACNYEETFPYICSALGSYARTCSSMGLILENWRNSMDNCTITCTGNQTFSYNTQACDRTCLSLSNRALECHPADIPIEGCHCPKGTYLNHKNECVRRSYCPCYLEDRKYILPDQSTITGGITCYCVNGKLSCTGKPQNPAESCKAPKKYISCSDSLENKYGAACAPTCQMLATGIECIPTRCESGCVCADGLYENLDGRCVPAEECPCEYGGLAYAKGEQIQTECEICTCTKGKWKCVQKSKCSSTCNLYGEGHITTFDGQRFVFDGNCEYILAMDGCSVNRPASSFKIVTENVICGRSGVTCSRSISINLGNLTFILRDETFTISGENPGVRYSVKKNALHLMFDIIILGKYNMTLIWNKHMTLFIKISRETQETICGLCGNYNGNMKDDFETRSKYVASSELEFVNSWKENPLCGDVYFVVDPCNKNPYRKAWAEKTCSIINSQVFSACHNKVNRMPYYEACVRDSCGCDIGGDCECMCDAIAVYAMACLDKGICIDWRTPEFCPVYCEYYNSHKKPGSGGAYSYGYSNDNCTWHYRPCNCPNQNYKYVNIEGCYNCSHDEYFDHEKDRCMPCGPKIVSTTPEISSPSTVATVQPKVTRSFTTSTLPTVPHISSSAAVVSTETTNPTITSKITVPRTSSASPLVTVKSTTESKGTQATTLYHQVPVVVTHRRSTKPHIVQHLITQKTTSAISASSTSVPREVSLASSPEAPLTRMFPSPSSLPATSASSPSSPSSTVSSTQLRPSYPAREPTRAKTPTSKVVTGECSGQDRAHEEFTPEMPTLHTFPPYTVILIDLCFPPGSLHPHKAHYATHYAACHHAEDHRHHPCQQHLQDLCLQRGHPHQLHRSPSDRDVSKSQLCASPQQRAQHPAVICHHVHSVLHHFHSVLHHFHSVLHRSPSHQPPAYAYNPEAQALFLDDQSSNRVASTAVLCTLHGQNQPAAVACIFPLLDCVLDCVLNMAELLTPRNRHPTAPSCPSRLSVHVPCRAHLPTSFAFPSCPHPQMTCASLPAAFTHTKPTMPHIMPPVTTQKTTATTPASSTSGTSASRGATPTSSTEAPLTGMSPSPSSAPAPSSAPSTRLPSATTSTVSSTTSTVSSTTSTVSSTAAPATSPQPTPTTLRPRPFSLTTRAPTELPPLQSSAPSTAKTSPLPSPASSPSSTVSSTWLSSSHPAFTHTKPTMPHIMPPVTTQKTTATTPASSTSRTSASRGATPTSSTEAPLTGMSPSPSSAPAPSMSSTTSTVSSTTSTVSSTAAPATSPQPTPTTLRPRPFSLTTRAPTELPPLQSSAPSTAKTSPLPSPASSPSSTVSSTVSSTWLSSSHPGKAPCLPSHCSACCSHLSCSVSSILPSGENLDGDSAGRNRHPTAPSCPSRLSVHVPCRAHLPTSFAFPSCPHPQMTCASLPAASTHTKPTMPHIMPPVTTQKTTATTPASSTSGTSASRGATPTSSTEAPLTGRSPSPSSAPAPSSAPSTRLPSATTSTVSSTTSTVSSTTSTVSSTAAPSSRPTRTSVPLTTSTFRSAESTPYFSSPNTTFSPYGEIPSSVPPATVSAKSTPVLIPTALITTTLAPGVITTVSMESAETTSLRTTLTTTRTTSSSFSTSGLSTTSSSVGPFIVPQERCEEHKYEEKITYKGCSTNVTLSRCEGSCPSSTKWDAEKMLVSTACGCCRPLQLLKKEFQLPCQDPDNPRKRLVTEIIVFSSCVCDFDSCTH